MAIEAPKPKVLIPEKVSADGLSLMQKKSLNVEEKKGLSADQLLEIIGTWPSRSDAGSDANGLFSRRL
jgi:D-3-phosphoglycerate dehydrogenase